MCHTAPSRNSATSVVPPPTSISSTPSSRSSGVRTDSPEARDWSTTSSTVRPARLTLRTTFWTAVPAPATRCTETPSRLPSIPTGSRTPSWSSTVKPWVRACRISRSGGRLTARAASTARATSMAVTSRVRPWIATTPWLLIPRMCPPPIDTYTASTSTPAACSASEIARLIASTVDSTLATTPFRSPREACWPIPITSTPVGVTSPMTAQTLVVPTSSPVMMFCVLRTFSVAPGQPRLALRELRHPRARGAGPPRPPPGPGRLQAPGCEA